MDLIVTLSTEDDGEIKAHKSILISCSTLFKRILQKNRHPNPIIYLKGINLRHLESVLKYVYQGKCEIAQEDLSSFLINGRYLQIEGLQEVTETDQSVSVFEDVREGFKLKVKKTREARGKFMSRNCVWSESRIWWENSPRWIDTFLWPVPFWEQDNSWSSISHGKSSFTKPISRSGKHANFLRKAGDSQSQRSN